MTVDGVANHPFTDDERGRVERQNALDLLPSVAARLPGGGIP